MHRITHLSSSTQAPATCFLVRHPLPPALFNKDDFFFLQTNQIASFFYIKLLMTSDFAEGKKIAEA